MQELAMFAAKWLPTVLGFLDALIAIRKKTEADYPEVWKNVTQPGYVSASDAYARAGGAILGGVGVAAAPSIARGTIRSINRVAESTTGQGFLNPEAEAARRLREAAQRDNPNAIRQEMQDYAATGASDPTLLDVSGNNVSRLIRSAASGGEGAVTRLLNATK